MGMFPVRGFVEGARVMTGVKHGDSGPREYAGPDRRTKCVN